MSSSRYSDGHIFHRWRREDVVHDRVTPGAVGGALSDGCQQLLHCGVDRLDDILGVHRSTVDLDADKSKNTRTALSDTAATLAVEGIDMSGPEPAAGREIAPKDVFARSNMPSRWERLTNVSPKTAPDRRYLAFVAARFRGDELLPRPADLEPPEAVGTRRAAGYVCGAAAALASVLLIIGVTANLPAAAVAAVAMLVAVLMGAAIIAIATQSAITEFNTLRARSAREESRLHSDSLDPENTSTLNAMINHDEGTLAYCAAKIAAEIDQVPAWHSTHIDIVPIDLCAELTDIGESARQIAEDHKATRLLEKGRLRDDPDVRSIIREDKQQRAEALALLAARVSAFADYRDHVHRVSITAGRDSKALSRAVRRVADQQAAQRLR